MYSLKKLILVSCLFYSICVSVSAQPSNFAVGSYNFSKQPFILKTDDRSESWTFINKIDNLPQIPMDNINFKKIQCKHNICLAVGKYWKSNRRGINIPLLLLSKDHGQSWSFIDVIPNLPDTFEDGRFKTFDCTENACIVAGDGWYDHFKNLPLIVRVNVHDGSWSLQTPAELRPRTGYYNLNHVYCDHSRCFIVGQYIGNHSEPLIAISSDEGVTWSLIKDIYGGFAHNVQNDLETIHCVDDVCTAAGILDNYPLFLISQNRGLSWSYLDMTSVRGLRKISPITCHAKHCFIATTIDRGNFGFNDPAIFFSENGGLTWSFHKNISHTPLNWKSGKFNSINCSKTFCAAAGEYYSIDGLNLPALIVSNDAGKSWSFVISVFNIHDGDEGKLKYVSCTNNTCITVGSYLNLDKNLPLSMLLLNTNDNGVSWQRSNVMNLPNNFVGSELHAVSE